MAPTPGFLVIEFQGNVIRTLPLNFDTLTIGRAPDNDLSLQHPGVSRHHLELELGPDGMTLTDLGSVNGTFVDDVRVLPHQPTRLELGRALRVGPFILAARRSPADTNGWLEPLAPEPTTNGTRHAPAAPDPAEFERALARRAAAQRPTAPPSPPPLDSASRYLEYLPTIFADNDFFRRFLLIFEAQWEPLEQRQDHMDMYFDPATCPVSFLSWLASWFDVEVGAHWPEDRLRELVGQATDLYRWRGTTYGLTRMIELWTGLHPTIAPSPHEPFVFHVRLTPPAGATVDRHELEELLRVHKPAHAGYVLEIA